MIFGASYYEIKTINMDFNPFRMFVTFQYRGLHYLEVCCTLTIEA